MWSDFPAGDDPRPLVLLGPRFHSSGFRTGEAKQAFLSGAVETAVALPDGLLDALPPRRPFAGPAITVTGIVGVHADFLTDRGLQPLPAWRLSITDTLQDCIVLDPTVRGWRPPGMDARWLRDLGLVTEARLASDGTNLRIMLGTGDRTYIPRLEFIEGEAAVVYEPVVVHDERPRRTANGDLIAENLALMMRPVSGRMPSPLGNHVLINSYGMPVTVSPDSKPWWNPDQ